MKKAFFKGRGGERRVSFRWFVEFPPLSRLTWFVVVVVVVVILLIPSERERERSQGESKRCIPSSLSSLSFLPSGDSSRKQDLG